MKQFQSTVAAFGFVLRPGRGLTWTASIDGVHVTLEVVPGCERRDEIVARAALEIGATALGIHRAIAIGGRLRTGDDAFDALVMVVADGVMVHAWLDAEVRHALSALVAHGAVVADGEVVWRVNPELDAAELADNLRLMTIVARGAQGATQDPVSRLVTIATVDASPGVRSRCRQLIDADPVLQRALQAATTVTGAHGDFGTKRLEEVLCDPTVSAGARTDALMALLDRSLQSALGHPAAVFSVARELSQRWRDERPGIVVAMEIAQFLLRHLDDHPEPAVRLLFALDLPLDGWRQCLDHEKRKRLFDLVLEHAQHGDSGSLCAALVNAPRLDPYTAMKPLRALGKTGDIAFQGEVRACLESGYEDIDLAALEALTTIGDLTSVPAVERLTKGLFRSARVKDQAKATLAAIQARHGAVQPGALTLADEHARGGMAITPDESDKI